MRVRLDRLAEDKANLQLVVRLMEQLIPLTGVADMVRGCLRALSIPSAAPTSSSTTGSATELHYADFFGRRTRSLTRSTILLAASVARSREFVEQSNDAAEALMNHGSSSPAPGPGAFR